MKQPLLSLPLVAAALLGAAGAAQATITLSSATTPAAFAAAVAGSIDSFSDLTINTDLGATSLARGVGGIGYTITTATDLFVVPVASAIAISAGSYADTISFGSFAPAVYKFGANFYGTNILGEVASGALTVTATDIHGVSTSKDLSGGSTAGFVGFISTDALASVVVGMKAPNTNVYATVDNAVVAVPEAGTLTMMLGGGALLLPVALRRRS